MEREGGGSTGSRWEGTLGALLLERRLEDRGLAFFSGVFVGGFMVELVVDDAVVGAVQSLSLPLLLAMLLLLSTNPHRSLLLPTKYVLSFTSRSLAFGGYQVARKQNFGASGNLACS